MNLKTIYKTLIWIGILGFISGVIGDANSLQYLRYGAIIGPIVFAIGVVIWIPLRLKRPILHPYNSSEYQSSGDALFAFIINNFVLEFWAFCCAFGMLIVIGGGSAMKSTAGFEAALNIIQNDQTLIEQIGAFNGTGTLVAGSTGTNEANLDFSAYGVNGGTRVNIKLKKEAGNWNVIKLKYD